MVKGKGPVGGGINKFVLKVTVSLSTFDDGGIFVPKIINGWLYKREGEYLETIQRFITRLWDSG